VFAFAASQERPELILLPIDGEYPAAESRRWRLAEPIVVAEYYGIVTLAPGGTDGPAAAGTGFARRGSLPADGRVSV
jgi:hypothetical protein